MSPRTGMLKCKKKGGDVLSVETSKYCMHIHREA